VKTIEVDELKGQQVRARALRAEAAMAGDDSAPLYEQTDHGWVTGKLEVEDAQVGYRRYVVGDYDVDPATIRPLGEKAGFPVGMALIRHMQEAHGYVSGLTPKPNSNRYKQWKKSHEEEYHSPDRWGDQQDHDHGMTPTTPTAPAPPDYSQAQADFEEYTRQKNQKLGYGEVTAPEVVDTLREADCPVCGDSEFDGKQCKKCGFQKPPDQYMDPDLDKAKEVDLRGGEEDPTAVGDEIANPGADDLVCDNCGQTFSSGGDDGGVKKVKTIPELPKPDDTDEDAAPDGTPGPADGKVEGDVEPGPDQPLKAGDQCPVCGKGKLVPNNAATADTAEGVFVPPEEVEDDPPKPVKEAASQKERSMRSALAALGEQQAVIERQTRELASQGEHIAVLEYQMGALARLAGVEQQLVSAGRQAVAKLRKKADVDNPAQPVPAPASEAPEESTEQALAPAGRDDVTSIGTSPVADVQPDAQTSVDAPQTVLDEPLDLNEENVTAPVAGTEGPLPLDKVKIETDVRVGNPDDPNPAFPLEGPFAQRATTGAQAAKGSESRAFASLRLARLRQSVGIAPGDPATDDLMLGQEIAESDMSDEVMAHEIGTLSMIVQQARANQRQAPRNLVPRSASANGQRPPSLRSEAAEIPVQTMAPGVTDEEFGFE
jgi:hypothetical protein